MRKTYEKPEAEVILLQYEAVMTDNITIGESISGIDEGVEDW